MRRLSAALVALWLAAGGAAAQGLPSLPPGSVLSPLRAYTNAALRLLAFSVVPDSAGSAIQIDRSSGSNAEDDVRIRFGQIGSGFTWSEEFPLYLEGYIGYARYDPRFVFTDGQEARVLPTRWNHVAATVGVGWDFRIAPNLFLRPIAMGSLAHITSDLALAGTVIELQTGYDFGFLDSGRMNVWGAGGGLVLAWYDYRPEREIEVELRGNHMHLETFAGTSARVRGSTEARTVTFWGRYRWPTGAELLGRPLRWALEANHTRFLDNDGSALGMDHLTKLGAGIELDVGALGIGPSGLEWQRLRLMGRYLFGERVEGFGIGIGMSF
jgi:hypothetical protein